MENLIKIQQSEGGKQVVSARELHEFLESKQDFSNWIKRRIKKYGFVENEEYSLLNNSVEQTGRGGHNLIEYAITLDMAKELSMVENNDKGRQARRYFIEAEKKYKAIALPGTYQEALRELANTKDLEEKATLQLEDANKTIKNNEQKVVFADSVAGSSNLMLIRHFAKVLSDGGFKIGQNRLFEWFRRKGYLNRDNEPYMNYVEQGLFEVITRTIGGADQTFTTRTTKLTGKGIVYFAKKIRES